MNVELSKYLSLKKTTIETVLEKYFETKAVPEKLHESMKYSVFSECKRFRPILAIASCEASGGNEEKVLPFACAIELIHTYSLIHDDLPSMDNDDLRRGKPTNHKIYSEATAILSGDALLTLAFEIASQPIEHLSPATQLKIIHLIAEASGRNGMVGGQELDIEGEDKNLNLEELKKIHLNKTGRLIQCAVQIGATLGDADKSELVSLCNYGENIGLAFQITDDILDFKGFCPGKTPKGDIKNKKSTFATILGEKKSREMVESTIDKAIASLKSFGDRADILKKLAEYIRDRIT